MVVVTGASVVVVLEYIGRFLVSEVHWTLSTKKRPHATIHDRIIGSNLLLQWTLWTPLDALDAFWGRPFVLVVKYFMTLDMKNLANSKKYMTVKIQILALF